MDSIFINIKGPGLVVNNYVDIIFDTLIQKGLYVKVKDFDGMERDYSCDKKENEKFSKITISVDAMPWGG